MIRISFLIKILIERIIMRVYPLFERFIPLETFRYAFCGGANTAFDIFLFFISYNFILKKQIVHLGFVAISPHIASFLMVFPITFATGFLLAKYITFTSSQLRGRIQLFRYGVTVSGSILLNYLFLKLFVDVCGFYPTPSKMLTTMLVIVFSFFSQKYFTFKVGRQEIN